MFSILLIALMQTPTPLEPTPEVRKFYVYHDEGWRSRVLVSELTRNWKKTTPSARLSKAAIAQLEGWSDRQAEIMKSIELVSHSGPRTAATQLREYPAYSYGEYGKVETFDPRTFTASGYPLLTIEALIANTTADLTTWKEECDSVVYRAEHEHLSDACEWLRVTHRREWEEMVTRDYSFDGPWPTYSFSGMRDQFGAYDGYPSYTPPILPKCPLRKLPWE